MQQPQTVAADAIGIRDRRKGADRRRYTARTFIPGGLTPRRRGGRRHGEDGALVDWHEPHLLFMAVTILLLSVADAFLTLTLMRHGAHEANPVLAYVLAAHPGLFAIVKMALTGAGVIVLVMLGRARVFRVIRVAAFMHWFLLVYVGLIAYEWWLLRDIL